MSPSLRIPFRQSGEQQIAATRVALVGVLYVSSMLRRQKTQIVLRNYRPGSRVVCEAGSRRGGEEKNTRRRGATRDKGREETTNRLIHQSSVSGMPSPVPHSLGTSCRWDGEGGEERRDGRKDRKKRGKKERIKQKKEKTRRRIPSHRHAPPYHPANSCHQPREGPHPPQRQ